MDFPDNLFLIVIADFAFDAGDHFSCAYNVVENGFHKLRIEAIHEIQT